MKKFYLLIITALSFTYCDAQLTGTKTVPTDYGTLALAINALNTQGVGPGGVTITVIAGNPETAPAGGYVIGGAGSPLLTTTSAVNPVIIQGNGNIITASGTQTANALNDAIFKLLGADYITLTGFTMQENPANTITTPATNNMTEWGVALLYATATDGAQNNTIQNNTIALNRSYVNTFGIYSNSTHNATSITGAASATGTAGANSGLKIYNNNINNVNFGICIIGPLAAADQNTGVDIGGTSLATGNTITNFGSTTTSLSGYLNVSGTINGILVRNSTTVNISYNTITSSSGATGIVAGTLNGIQMTASTNTPVGTYTNSINNNIINLSTNVTAGAINGINIAALNGSLNTTFNINNNRFTGIGYTAAAPTGATVLIAYANGATALSTTINGNTFENLSTASTGAVTFISRSGNMPSGSSETVNNNSIVGTFVKTGAGASLTGFGAGSTSAAGTTMTNTGNNFSNITVSGATTISLWANQDGLSATTGPAKTITNNTFNNITSATGGITVMNIGFSPNPTISGNTVSNINTVSGNVFAINWSNTFNANVTNNTLSSFTASGAGILLGLVGATVNSGVHNVTGNTLTGFTTGGGINAIQIGSTTVAVSNITYNISNTIVNGMSSTGTSSVFGLLGSAFSGSSANVINMFKNNFSNFATNNAAGVIYGMLAQGPLTLNAYNNFISDLRAPVSTSTTATSVNGIYGNATSANIYYNTIVLGKASTLSSTGANFGVTGIQYSTLGNIIQNNIIWIDATPAGTGTVSAIRRLSAGTAGTAPAAANFTANNNIYNVQNPGINKYLYLEGISVGAVKNGYGTNIGIADDNVNNLINDASFNTPCGKYKIFMGPAREAATFTEDNLTASGTTPNITYAPTGLSYANNSAAPISSPSITNDYNGVSRSATPDMGALEFAGTSIDATGPAITFTNIPNTVCTNAPVLNAQITDLSGVNVTPGTAPRLYFRKSTENDVFLNYPLENNSAFNGWKYVEATGTGPNFSFALNYGLLTSPVADGDSITYFVTAQDLNGVPNVGKNTVIFAPGFCPTSVVMPSFGAAPTSGSLGYKISSATGNYITVADGEWNNPATWACGSVPPTNATSILIATNVTVSNTGNIGGSVTINPGSSLTMNAGGVLTLGRNGGDKISFINNGTLTVNNGLLTVNGNMIINNGANFSQANGLISVDGNAAGVAANSVPAGTDIFAIGTSATNYSTGTISLTGGTLQIVDPQAGASGSAFAYYGFTVANNITTGSNFILQIGDGVSTDAGGSANGFLVNLSATFNAAIKPNLVVNAPAGTNRTVFSAITFIGLQNLTVTNGELSTTNGAVSVVVNKNILVNSPGIYTTGATGTLYMGDLIWNGGSSITTTSSANAQTVSGTGILRNLAASPTANLTNFTVNNTNIAGVSLQIPVQVSGTLLMTAGLINNTSNLLTLGTTIASAGTLTYTAGRISGSFKRWITAATGSRQFPMGTATDLKNAAINYTTAPTTAGSLTAFWSPTPPAAPAPALVEPSGNLTVDAVSSKGSWFINAGDGLAGGLYTATFTANNTTDVVDYTKTVLVKRPSAGGAWILDGTHVVTTGSNSAPILSRTGMSGFSEFAIGGQNLVVLPVSIEFFTGSKQGTSDYLTWKVNCTSSPSVTLVLERSADGRSFSAIETQNATSTRCLQDFNYTDVTPLAGINYYRLKIITPDGAFRYSNIVALLNKSKGFELISVAPNPVQSSTVLSVTSVKSGKLDIAVSDVTGKVVMNQTVTIIAGNNALNMDFSKLRAGTYQISAVNADGERKTTRFVKF